MFATCEGSQVPSSTGAKVNSMFSLLFLAPNVNNPVQWAQWPGTEWLLKLRFKTNLKQEGEYVVVLGINHTCTALQYKPVFTVTR